MSNMTDDDVTVVKQPLTLEMIHDQLQKLDQLADIRADIKQHNETMERLQDGITKNTTNIGTLQTSHNAAVVKLNTIAKDEANKQAAIHRSEMQSIRVEQQSKK